MLLDVSVPTILMDRRNLFVNRRPIDQTLIGSVNLTLHPYR